MTGVQTCALPISSSVVSVGIVLGAWVGGILIDGPGFPALGIVCAVVGMASALIVIFFVHEEPMDLEAQPA